MQHSLIHSFYSDSWNITNKPKIMPWDLKASWVSSVLLSKSISPEASTESRAVWGKWTHSRLKLWASWSSYNQVTLTTFSVYLHALSLKQTQKREAQYNDGSLRRLINGPWGPLRWSVKSIQTLIIFVFSSFDRWAKPAHVLPQMYVPCQGSFCGHCSWRLVESARDYQVITQGYRSTGTVLETCPANR